MKLLYFLVIVLTVIQGCTVRNSQNAIEEKDYCIELLEQYIIKSKYNYSGEKMYFCIGIDIINEDTLISMRGGPNEEYWSSIDDNGNYQEVSPNILYKKINGNVMTFYPANKDLAFWSQSFFGCSPIDSNTVNYNTIVDRNYDPVEITFRFNNKLKTFDFQHFGLHRYNQPLQIQEKDWLLEELEK